MAPNLSQISQLSVEPVVSIAESVQVKGIDLALIIEAIEQTALPAVDRLRIEAIQEIIAFLRSIITLKLCRESHLQDSRMKLQIQIQSLIACTEGQSPV